MCNLECLNNIILKIELQIINLKLGRPLKYLKSETDQYSK